MRGALVVAACGVAGLAVLAVRLRATYLVIRVHGSSMAPALTHGDRVLSRRIELAALRNGQIAVVASPRPTGSGFLIKRVVAVPGDPVPEQVRRVVADDVVPAGRFVLIGDNTEVSFDSREHGFFHADDLHAVTVRKLELQHGR